MKSVSRRSGGFTLIEMLVVIAIIGVLAGLLLPALTRAKTAAMEAQARTEISGILAASKAYYNEYGKWPSLHNGDAGDVTYYHANGSKTADDAQRKVIDMLRGIDDVNNPRQIIFLEVPDKSLKGSDKEGRNYVKDDGFFLDPWGNPYFISFDTDFDNLTHVDHISSGGLDLDGQTVAVWSYGKGDPDVDSTDTNFFLKSWE